MTPEHEQSPTPYLPPTGARPDYFRDPRFKSPFLAPFLSLLPGLGQVYLGYTRLGFIHAAIGATFVACMSSNQLGRILEPAVGFMMFFFWLYNLIDAHRRALLFNEAVTQMKTPEVPDGFGALSIASRLGLGVALVLAGVLAFLNIHFGLSFAWLQEWWPLGLVGFGFYLVLRAVRDRAAESAAPEA